MIVDYTHDEYCVMLVILVACSVGVGTATWLHPPDYAGQLHPEESVTPDDLEECLRDTLTSLFNARCH